ncbi:MAG: 2-hydroxyacid dehydrogenase [Gammaproteobacteria bacterium]
MKVSVFSTKPYDEEFLERINKDFNHQLSFHSCPLTPDTINLVEDDPCVCVFVHDKLNRKVIEALHQKGVKLIALRCAGFNNVDLDAAKEYGIVVVRVPAYSPEAVAEHAVGLMLSLSRKIHRAYNRVREGNFSLNGLLGFELHSKTAGIVGTGRIGTALAKILTGFGTTVIASDIKSNETCHKLGVEYVSFDELCRRSDVISLHCPLTPDTYHLIDEQSIDLMKQGVMLINTSRGAVLDTQATIEALKSNKIGYLGLDVYEQEEHLFFEDLSDKVITDDVFERLLTFPNVLITGHQAFFTAEAMTSIAHTTLQNISCFESGDTCATLITADDAKP